MRWLLLLALLVAPAATAATKPPQIYCLTAAERKQAIWFAAGDGTRLAGLVLGKGTRGIVLGHQSQGSLCETLGLARRYARSGYRVLTIDFRGHGYSTRSARRPNALDSDVAGAVRELRRRGATKVVLVGASMGAGAVLVSASKIAVDGVVSLSAPGAFMGLEPLATAPKLTEPVLYAAAEADQNAGFDFAADARKMHDAAGSAEKALLLVTGIDHGWRLLDTPSTRSAVDAFIRARFA